MPKRIPKKIMTILNETRECFNAIYAQRVKELILFGSYARGDYDTGSDIDLLLLLDHLDDMETERARYMPTVCELSLKYDTVVSVIPMEYEKYRTRKTPLIINVQREGVRL
jgi:predicted nucleotidyltransferase